MKEKLIEKYKKSLLNIYDHHFLDNCPYDYVVVLKDGEEKVKDHILYTNYLDFYKHEEFKMLIPPLRKTRKLLTYQEGLEILNRVTYGTLSISNNFPYCIGINYIVKDNAIYFHTGHTGYKLHGIGKLACLHVVEDLGIHKEAFTHNHKSVTIYGTLEEVKENKKEILESFLLKLTPGFTKQINERVINNTIVLKLSIDHMTAKKHYH